MSHFRKIIRGQVFRSFVSESSRSVVTDRRRMRRLSLWVESVESRQLLTLPAVLTIPMMPELDQFGDQILVVQGYGVPDRAALGIFDSGASAVTFAGQDQEFFGMGDIGSIPIKVPGGAMAEGIGGAIVGDVSQPGTIYSDGMHSFDLSFDEIGFPQFNIALSASALETTDIQAFVGTEDSPLLPTITGTPALNASPKYPDGAAAHVEMLGAMLDFSDIFPDLIIPFPDLNFANPGETIAYDPANTDIHDTVVLPLIPFGGDNSDDPGDLITESLLWLIPNVSSTYDNVTSSSGSFLFDTGAQLSVISTEMAISLGLNLDAPTTSIDVQGVAGTTTIPGYTLTTLDMLRSDGGVLQFTNVPVYVLDVAPGIDGIFGMNLMNVANEFVFDPHAPTGPQLSIAYFANPDRGAPPADDGLGELAALFNLVGLNVLGGALGGTQSLPRFDVPKINSTTSMTVPATAVEFGSSWSIDTSVGFPSGSPAPTGTVELQKNGVVFATPAINAQGKATWSSPTTPWEPGTYQITASYTGDSKYNASVSTAKSLTIAKASTALTLQGTGVSFGQSLTVTGELTAGTGLSVLNAPIQLKVDGSVVANTIAAADGSYAFTVDNLTAGAHSFQAIFNETANFKPTSSAPSSIVITKAETSVTLVSSVSPIQIGQSLTLSGKLISNPVAASVLNSMIQFKVDGASVPNVTATIGTDGNYTFSLNNLAVGTHTIQAVFGETTNFKGSVSATLSVVVSKVAGVLAITAPSTAVFGQVVQVTAQVPSAQASVYEGAVVTFYDDTKILGTSKMQSGKAVWNFNSTKVGLMPHFIAKIAETATGKAVTSPMAMMSVGKAGTSLSWTIVKKPANNQEWTIKVLPTSPGSGTPSGQIKITLGGAKPVTTTLKLVAGKVVYKFKAPAGVPKSIAFVGDTNFSASSKTV